MLILVMLYLCKTNTNHKITTSCTLYFSIIKPRSWNNKANLRERSDKTREVACRRGADRFLPKHMIFILQIRELLLQADINSSNKMHEIRKTIIK